MGRPSALVETLVELQEMRLLSKSQTTTVSPAIGRSEHAEPAAALDAATTTSPAFMMCHSRSFSAGATGVNRISAHIMGVFYAHPRANSSRRELFRAAFGPEPTL